MKEVWTEGHQQSKAAGHRQGLKDWVSQTARRRSTSPHGKKKDMDRRNRRLPPGEEVTRSLAFMSYHSKTVFFFQASRSSTENKDSQWGFLWVERSIRRRGSWADRDSEATKLSTWAEQGGVENVQYATNHNGCCVLYVFNAPLRSAGTKRRSWAERECPSNAGLDS